LAYGGLLLILFSVWLAYAADEQLKKIRKVPASNRKMTGLWSSSRHPNYLGEILTWWGILLVGLSFGMEYWWTGVGAVTITLMFVFISIPLMEKHMIRKNPKYAEYKEKVPALLPLRLSPNK
jgi:steroid 5-alpha reductase family enzyme